MCKRLGYLGVVAGSLLLTGCAVTSKPKGPVPLIPRSVLFGNPDRARPDLSPDGSRIGYLAPVDGVLNVWVASADNLKAARPVTHDTGRGIRGFFFPYTNEHVLYLQDHDGDENYHLYAVDLSDDSTKDLTPYENVSVDVVKLSPKFPDKVLVGINDRNPTLRDLYEIDLRSGERSLVMANEGFMSYICDDELKVRFGEQSRPDGSFEYSRRVPRAWEPFITVGPDDSLTTQVLGFDKSGSILFMRDSRDRNTSALVSINLETGQEMLIAEDPKADVARVLRHPTEKTMQAVMSNYQRERWCFFDLRVKADFDLLRSLADGEIRIMARTLDDLKWVVALWRDNGPTLYYLYDRVKREPRFLFTSQTALEEAQLARMHPVTIKSRDGFELVSYLTLPVHTDPDGDGRPAAPLPMVLLVHGGPWGRDAWGYNPYHQWLANRGYAVLSVNFRGSTGLGKEFVNAGDMEWAGNVHHDLLDGVNWAVAEGIADPARVAIMGGSYGGYATLVGLTLTPDVFACGVDMCGPSNFITLLESVPPYWTPMLNMLRKRVGNETTEEGREFLRQISPLTYAERICKPLLIGQGGNDPRVKRAESDQIVSAMQAKGIPVTYVVYPDEGHGFARPANQSSFHAVAEAFLAEYLGGRCEPVGEDFEGSSISVEAGLDLLPLDEAARAALAPPEE